MNLFFYFKTMKKGFNTIKVHNPILWTPYVERYHTENPNLWGHYSGSIFFSILQGNPMYLVIPGSLSKSKALECVVVKSVEEAKQLAEQTCRDYERQIQR
jgi:hypothetical protein